MSIQAALTTLREEHDRLGKLLADADGNASQLAAIGACVERMASIVGAPPTPTKNERALVAFLRWLQGYRGGVIPYAMVHRYQKIASVLAHLGVFADAIAGGADVPGALYATHEAHEAQCVAASTADGTGGKP